MKKYVVIVAGGKGKRMGNERPKQFLEIGNLPILMHTFRSFSFLGNAVEFILVLSTDDIDHWEKLCKIHDFNILHQIVEAGPKRFHSVKSGLKLVPENALVAIHDAVRPFVSKQIIEACFTMAARKGNAVPVIPIGESVRELSGTLNKSIDRNRFRLAQTPQVFVSSDIKKAYQQPYSESFTDDASVLERMGKQIFLVEGNSENIKITHPADIAFVESFIQSH